MPGSHDTKHQRSRTGQNGVSVPSIATRAVCPLAEWPARGRPRMFLLFPFPFRSVKWAAGLLDFASSAFQVRVAGYSFVLALLHVNEPTWSRGWSCCVSPTRRQNISVVRESLLGPVFCGILGLKCTPVDQQAISLSCFRVFLGGGHIASPASTSLQL